MGLQHSFNSFGKWCSFPQELFNVKKTGNAGHAFDDQRETTTYFYLTEERRRTYTSPTSMLLVILFYKVPAVFNIFVVKYNPVSQSTKLTCSILLDDVDWPAAYFGRSHTQFKGKLLYSIR